MGRLQTTLATAGLVLAMWATASAQNEKGVTTTKGNTDTGSITVTGNQTTDYVQRDRALTAFRDSESNQAGTGNILGSASENTFEGETGIRFNAELSNKVAAVLEIGTRRIDGDPAVGPGGVNRYGEGEALAIKLKEAHVLLPVVFLPELKAQLGITTWKFNPRGKGGSLAFDPRNAQTVTRNIDSDGTPFNGRDDGVNRLIEAAFVEPSMPVGAVFTYQGTGPFMLDFVFLPAMAEESGPPRDDDQLYAIDGMMNLDALGAGSRVGLIVALTSVRTDAPDFTPGNNEGRTRMITLGGGTSIKVLESVEVHFEGYVQKSKAGELLSGQRIEAGGHAVRTGIAWNHTVANPMPIWAAIDFTHISGENSDNNTNRKASRFAAYESVADLMIMEDPYFGYDWDSNFQAVKVSGGLSLSAASENDLDLMFIAGVMRAAKRVQVPTGLENKLGNEVDLRMTWHMTKQFSFRLAFAYLWGSKILEDAMGGPNVPEAQDSTFLFVLGWDMTF